MMHLFFPMFYVRNKRFRCSARFISWRGLHYKKDIYPEGIVYRFWFGFILVVVMVDDA